MTGILQSQLMRIKSLIIATLIVSSPITSAAIVSQGATDAAVIAINGHIEATEIITRCDVPADYREHLQQAKLGINGGGTGSEIMTAEQAVLTLVMRGNSYELLLGQESIDSDAALIHAGGNDPLHLILDKNSGIAGIEHFLFDLNLDGSGELLWSSASESALTTCVAGI